MHPYASDKHQKKAISIMAYFCPEKVRKNRWNHTIPAVYGCGGRTRTYGLRVMSPTSCQLLHAAIFTCRPSMVPVTGLEPVRYRYRGILSPLCLPIPPHRRISAIDRIPYSPLNVKSFFPTEKNFQQRETLLAVPHMLVCTLSHRGQVQKILFLPLLPRKENTARRRQDKWT